jgi:hypothetical protein
MRRRTLPGEGGPEARALETTGLSDETGLSWPGATAARFAAATFDALDFDALGNGARDGHSTRKISLAGK